MHSRSSQNITKNYNVYKQAKSSTMEADMLRCATSWTVCTSVWKSMNMRPQTHSNTLSDVGSPRTQCVTVTANVNLHRRKHNTTRWTSNVKLETSDQIKVQIQSSSSSQTRIQSGSNVLWSPEQAEPRCGAARPEPKAAKPTIKLRLVSLTLILCYNFGCCCPKSNL